MIELPSGPFGAILADPPWQFTTRDGKPDSLPTSATRRHGSRHYSTTSTEDLMKLPVGDVAAKDAALFMWVVDSHFTQALELGAAWGFRFNTCAFVWVKSRGPQLNPVPGMGFWTRKQVEQCWLFTRGKPKRQSAGVEQLLYSGRGAHSAKPETQYERVEALVGGPYLEMFARITRPGWASWGNQVGVRDPSLGVEALGAPQKPVQGDLL